MRTIPTDRPVQYLPLARRHLAGVMRLCRVERWPSYLASAERTWRALTAPGSCTVVAVEDSEVVGFAQLLSDGLIQAHLTLIAVARAHRRRGIGRRLLEEGLARAGGLRVDLVSTEGAHGFYRAFEHRRFPGFRIYPRRPSTRAGSRGERRRRGRPAAR
jgi:ribosomal protein S18 acetylase RimI-like enzyme